MLWISICESGKNSSCSEIGLVRLARVALRLCNNSRATLKLIPYQETKRGPLPIRRNIQRCAPSRRLLLLKTPLAPVVYFLTWQAETVSALDKDMKDDDLLIWALAIRLNRLLVTLL